MKLGNLSEFYYTAAEARRVLGVDENTFQYWGRSERINRIHLPGRKQPVYSKKEIDDIARGIEAAVIMEKAKETEFRRATVPDLENENQLAQLVFGKAAGAMPRRMFLERNPESDYHLYDQGKLVAYITIFPLKKETLERFMNGEIRGWQIEPGDIELFEAGKPMECVIMDMITTPTVEPVKRAEYGRKILINVAKVFQSWGERGVEIRKLHAIGGTPAGQHILSSAGFQEIKRVGPGRVAYELDMERAEERLIQKYRDALRKWKQSQTEAKTSSGASSRRSRTAKT